MKRIDFINRLRVIASERSERSNLDFTRDCRVAPPELLAMTKFCLYLFLCFYFAFSPAASLFADDKPVVAEGRKVKLLYVLTSEGKVVDKKDDAAPLEFEFGKDTLMPAFKKNIIGMKAGEKKNFELSQDDAFGAWDASKVQTIIRSQLPADIKLGVFLTATNPVTNQTVTGRVTKIMDNQVELDFNHPLAGKTVQVEVKVLEVK